MNYLNITTNAAGHYIISAEYNGIEYAKIRFVFYTKKQAIAKYRRDNGLRYKHLTIIEYWGNYMNIINTLITALLAWISVSFMDIIANNLNANPVYFAFDFFTLIF